MKNFNGTVVQTVHSIRKKAVGLLAVFLCIMAANQVSYGQCTPTYFDVNSAPTITGTPGAVGTTYKRTNVTPGVDMVMQIVSLNNGATVSNEDSLGTGTAMVPTGSGYAGAWQPTINATAAANGDAFVKWKISFFATGTSTPYTFNCLSLLAVDIDGDNGTLKEFVEVVNPYSFAGQSTGTHLTYNSTSGVLRSEASDVTTIANTDSAQKQAMSLFRYKNVSSFQYTTGYNKTSSSTTVRQFCLFFNASTVFPSAFSRYYDTDGDGVTDINNPTDLDDDNDGIPDTAEYPFSTDPFGDADGDGLANYEDPTPGTGVPAWVDANGDGVSDKYDADLDGIINSLDLDSDNDGIPDIVEAGGVDRDGDGKVDSFTDTNGNGLADVYDPAVTNGVAIRNLDTDGDGIPNARDLDSDNDGIPDVVEVGGVDTNGDGVVDTYFDIDGDGFDDRVDGDVGNDGTAENTANALLITGTYTSATNPIPVNYIQGLANTDARGLPNPYDLDSDDDGIADVTEAGGTDANYDGKIDGFTDTDGDGFSDNVDGSVLGSTPILKTGADTDSDGKPNSYPVAVNADGNGPANPYDLDSDNDGVPDVIESGGVDTDGDGRISPNTDTNANGWLDSYDPTLSTPGINIRLLDDNGSTAGGAIFDFDGDGIPNYLDLDSDNDGIPDIIEQGGADANNNGRVDVYADIDNDGFADIYDPRNNNTGATPTTLGTAIITTGSTLSTYNTPTTYSTGDNLDGTGLINMLDLDADGDGITDVKEAGFAESTTTLGFAAGTISTNGWSATVSASTTSALSLPNTDARSAVNYLDIDADDDGITDNIESQTTTGYILPLGTDTDADGIDDAYETVAAKTTMGGAGIVPVDKDSDGIPDYKDTDTDNDGISDLKESVGDPAYVLSTIQMNTDTDGDGLLDVFDAFNIASVASGWLSNVTMQYMGASGSTTGPATYGSNARIYKTSVITSADRDWRNALIILPVKLISFTAAYSSKVADINWTMANEDGHEHYILERSIDAKTFQAVSSTVAKGTAASNYTYADNAIPAVNVVYYRLQMVNADGSISYSKVVAIRLNADKLNLSIYPNPVVDQVSISFASTTTQAVNVKVYNMQGAQVMAKVYKAQAGTNTLQLTNWSKLPAGDYLIEVSNENFKLTHKLSHVH